GAPRGHRGGPAGPGERGPRPGALRPGRPGRAGARARRGPQAGAPGGGHHAPRQGPVQPGRGALGLRGRRSVGLTISSKPARTAKERAGFGRVSGGGRSCSGAPGSRPRGSRGSRTVTASPICLTVLLKSVRSVELGAG